MSIENLEACAKRYIALRTAIVNRDESFLDKLEQHSNTDSDRHTAEEIDAIFDRVMGLI